MDDFISDHKLRTMLQDYLSTQPNYDGLKNLALCSKGTIPTLTNTEPAVFLYTNDKLKRAKLSGVILCHSAWACPYCSARVMAKKGADIACLIDALSTWHNQIAIMITYTIPHLPKMSCKTTYDCIRKIWRHFTKTKSKKNYTTKDGTQRTYYFKAYGGFQDTMNSNYNVKIYEFTWGKYSWHPHIHQLFFLPKEKLSQVKDWIEPLRKSWRKSTEAIMSKELDEKTFQDIMTYPHKEENNYGFYISLDENGNPRIQKSSYYVSGWSGDREVTGLSYKTPHEGHYTPQMLLQEVYENNDDTPIEYNKYFKLYLEYAKATRKTRRVEFSKQKNFSCKKIIEKWKQTAQYKKALLKKNMDRDHGKWEAVYWFSSKQWKAICEYQYFYDPQIVNKMLECIHKPKKKRRRYIEDLIKNIDLPDRDRKLTVKEQKIVEYWCKAVNDLDKTM